MLRPVLSRNGYSVGAANCQSLVASLVKPDTSFEQAGSNDRRETIGRFQCSRRSFFLDQRHHQSIPEVDSNAAHILHRVEAPLLGGTVGQLLQDAAKLWTNRECIVSVHQNARLTYGDVLRRTDAFAAGLKKLGMKKGDRIGLWGPNDVEWYLAFISALRLGLIVVAINPAYQVNELMYGLTKTDTKILLSPKSFKTQNYASMALHAKEHCPALEHVILYTEDHVAGTRRFSDIESSATRVEVEAISAEQGTISSKDGCNIQFTSGTTGKPKATLISHGSLLNNSNQAARRGELKPGDRICMNVPFFHAFGTVMAQVGVLHAGSTFVLESPSFNPIKSLEAVAREKCTVMFGTPTMWVNLIAAQQRLRVPTGTLFSGTTGGSPASPELFKRIAENFGFENMKTIYGLTESTAILFQSLPGESTELRDTTVGHLSDHVEAKVVDANGETVPFGTPGELWTRGYCNMMRYWNDEANTKKTLTEDGWLKTGDQFILRADGYGHIVGRFKDMLIRGGENIFPKEIEDFLMTHPLISEAQVIGVHDDVYGEEICACLRLREDAKLTADELRNYCKGKIAHFKIPRYVVHVEEYPKTISGKIKKHQLKEELERKGVVPSKPK